MLLLAAAAISLVADVPTGRVIATQGQTGIVSTPGSTIKPFTLLALIEQGKLTSETKIACPGKLSVAGRVLNCSHPHLSEALDPVTALAYSCNYYFAKMSERLDVVRWTAMLRRYGFDVDAAPDRALLALGEAGVRTSPRGLLEAYRKLALEHNKTVVDGMEGAVAFGSAQWASVPNWSVAGKTGTTINATRTSTHAWFAGFAPASRPKYVMVVFAEEGRGGSTAAPIAAKLLAPYAPPLPPNAVTLRTLEGRHLAISMEDYVAGVLAGEAGNMREAEALKAMAVAARTYAHVNRGRHRDEGYDFCDLPHCQRWIENAAPAPVEATAGELLWYNGSPAQVFYHRHCGGRTEAAVNVWPNISAPYLASVEDQFCLPRSRTVWKAKVAKDVSIVSRTNSGRVKEVRYGGETMLWDRFRQLAGDQVKSALFSVSSGRLLDGEGHGHGVGLCQIGAAQRASKGSTYAEILAAYFPGTKIGVTAQGLHWIRFGGEKVELWTTQPSSAGDILASAERAMREAEARTGFPSPPHPKLRVYPTVAAFRDSTGEPGFIAASTLSNTIRLQPLRGPADGLLLHEWIHLILDARARRPLPPWFREGLALYLEDPAKPSSTAKLNGEHVAQPPSEPAMRLAYEAARSRVKNLADRYGTGTVLGWAERGLPASVTATNDSQPVSPTR